MARDHYLPAAYIGRFSGERRANLRSRDCLIWTAHLGASQPVQQKASSIGYEKGLYDLHPEGNSPSLGNSVDTWIYERELPYILDALSSGEHLSLSDWLHVAVPFVAGLFVRGPDYDTRYHERLSAIDLPFSDKHALKKHQHNQANFARVVEMQSLLLPIMAARWKVIHATGTHRCVLNDIGMVPLFDPAVNSTGWAIPLDTRSLLFLMPRRRGCFGTFGRDGQWNAVIEHLDEPDEFFEGLNELTAATAQRFVVSAEPEPAAQLLPLLSTKCEMQLRAYREVGWDIRRGIAAAGDDCMMWGAAACIADNQIPPEDLNGYRPSINKIDSKRWIPRILILQEFNNMGNGRVEFSGRNLFAGRLGS